MEITSKLEGEKAIFTIADMGTGIPTEEIEHIFEAFYRVDKSRSRKIAGSGLGLSIVDAVVKNHGGSVRIAKSDAQGTVVELVLPVEGM